MAAPADEPSEHGDITITLKHRGKQHAFEFDDEAEIVDLFDEIAESLSIPRENQKIIIPQKPVLTWPPKDSSLQLSDLQGKKLILMGTPAATRAALEDMEVKVARRQAARAAQIVKNKHSRPARGPSKGETTYTFLQVEPLKTLPNPERSRKMLLRLKEDPGIVASMRKHKFVVSMLTEMEPLSNTESSHEGTSRILGLNRNKGEVIELRLRTDAYDGYRDYKTIRKTLCHELAHNVHSEHDRKFWDLCNQIEKEVLGSDWKSGGHTIADTSRYHISGQDEEFDHEDEGGWTGGEFVLGGVREQAGGLSRREIIARAATERLVKEDKSEHKACKGWRPCQRRAQSQSDKSREDQGGEGSGQQ